jgi:LMBR1 domain-containing protein 1
MIYWVKLVAGVLGVGITVTWVLQMILYVLISPPVSAFLNDMFIA